MATAAILILAANTAYQDFPRLSAILADHRMMPRQYRNRGDRLVFSNGVVTLALGAGLLIAIFDAEVSRLIQLYVVGVFTSFTLSQTGMVRRWLRTREPGWQRSVVLNAVGAVTTGLVLVIVAVVKFSHGAWIVLIAIPLLVALMLAVRRHYIEGRRPAAAGATRRPGPGQPHAGAGGPLRRGGRAGHPLCQLVRSEHVQVVHAIEPDSDDLIHTWDRLYPDHRLELIDGEDESVVGRLLARVREERDRHPESKMTVVVSERFKRRSRLALLSHPNLLLLKARLLFEPGIAVTDVTSFKRRQRSGLAPGADATGRAGGARLRPDPSHPGRHRLRRGAGARRCAPFTSTSTTSSGTSSCGNGSIASYGYELEMVPSPYPGGDHSAGRPTSVTGKRLACPGTLVNVVIPEFIVPGRVDPGAPQPDRSGGEGGARPRARGGGHQRAVPPVVEAPTAV